MRIRQRLKYLLHSYCPGLLGQFSYFGTKVFFPKGSVSFLAACQQGIFEADNVRLLQGLVRPGSWYFDVGTNIGLMSIPVLSAVANVRVVSFEPSPNSYPSLRRTIEQSAFANRWTLITKAVGANAGQVSFTLSDRENSLFDGLAHTGNVAMARTLKVEQTTLDKTWMELGSPDVSVIKCDVEGAELDVLVGARECLRTMRPAVLLECNTVNFGAYGVPPSALLDFAKENEFSLHAVPSLTIVVSHQQLLAHCAFTESFLLLPR